MTPDKIADKLRETNDKAVENRESVAYFKGLAAGIRAVAELIPKQEREQFLDRAYGTDYASRHAKSMRGKRGISH